ncbi:hypothetical protein SUGI_0911180 [Cryptomeria japonica]|nr:hypothetical protein SUGI_0911180 [Cryptomeria japonica]
MWLGQNPSPRGYWWKDYMLTKGYVPSSLEIAEDREVEVVVESLQCNRKKRISVNDRAGFVFLRESQYEPLGWYHFYARAQCWRSYLWWLLLQILCKRGRRECYLVEYKMKESVKTFHLSGMGCSAGVLALNINLAKYLLLVNSDSYALILSTETITVNGLPLFLPP